MKLKNGAEYIESLRERHPIIYYNGNQIDDVNTLGNDPHLRTAAMTYSLACSKEYLYLAKANFHLT